MIVAMGWTEKERLVLTFSDGTVLVVTMFGETVKEFNLGRDARDSGKGSLSRLLLALLSASRVAHCRLMLSTLPQVCCVRGCGLVACTDRKMRPRLSKVVLSLN